VSTAESRGSDHGDLADRILDAAQRLVLRTGARKLSLSDVATLARVSRPTIYRYFVSKEDLIDAMGKRERRRFTIAMDNAMSGVVGVARL
jgi:AcrR family transcriptional regulator